MILYCEKCKLAYEQAQCPACGSREGRIPLPNDFCYLCEEQVMWGEMIAEVLRNNGILCIIKNKLGVGMALKVGPMMERVMIYVPFSRMQEAKDLIDGLLCDADEDDEREL